MPRPRRRVCPTFSRRGDCPASSGSRWSEGDSAGGGTATGSTGAGRLPTAGANGGAASGSVLTVSTAGGGAAATARTARGAGGRGGRWPGGRRLAGATPRRAPAEEVDGAAPGLLRTRAPLVDPSDLLDEPPAQGVLEVQDLVQRQVEVVRDVRDLLEGAVAVV